MIPVALALGSSLAWGLADFLGGLKSRSLALPTVLLLSQAVGLVITVAVVALAGEAPAASATLGWAALSGILDLAGLWALYRGLSRGSMSVVAPLAATAALVPTVYGIAIGERPAALALSGIALAVVGVALAGRSESADDGGPLARGVGLALLAALCFGLGFIALDTASEGGVIAVAAPRRGRARRRRAYAGVTDLAASPITSPVVPPRSPVAAPGGCSSTSAACLSWVVYSWRCIREITSRWT